MKSDRDPTKGPDPRQSRSDQEYYGGVRRIFPPWFIFIMKKTDKVVSVFKQQPTVPIFRPRDNRPTWRYGQRKSL